MFMSWARSNKHVVFVARSGAKMICVSIQIATVYIVWLVSLVFCIFLHTCIIIVILKFVLFIAVTFFIN